MKKGSAKLMRMNSIHTILGLQNSEGGRGQYTTLVALFRWSKEAINWNDTRPFSVLKLSECRRKEQIFFAMN